jgi:hypothetical protein
MGRYPRHRADGCPICSAAGGAGCRRCRRPASARYRRSRAPARSLRRRDSASIGSDLEVRLSVLEIVGASRTRRTSSVSCEPSAPLPARETMCCRTCTAVRHSGRGVPSTSGYSEAALTFRRRATSVHRRATRPGGWVPRSSRYLHSENPHPAHFREEYWHFKVDSRLVPYPRRSALNFHATPGARAR